MKSGCSSAWRIFFLQRPTTAVAYGFREEQRRRQKKPHNKTKPRNSGSPSTKRKAHRLLTTPPPPPVGLVPSTHTTQVTQVMWNVLARTPLLRFLPPCRSHAERHSALLQNLFVVGCFVFFLPRLRDGNDNKVDEMPGVADEPVEVGFCRSRDTFQKLAGKKLVENCTSSSLPD